jgi:hypothetical protein
MKLDGFGIFFVTNDFIKHRGDKLNKIIKDL